MACAAPCSNAEMFDRAIPAQACYARPVRRRTNGAAINRRTVMAVARVSKITAASSKGFQEAVHEGMKRATKTLRGVTGFEVISQKGKVEKGKVTEYRVTMEVTFILE
jgi:dodecin